MTVQASRLAAVVVAVVVLGVCASAAFAADPPTASFTFSPPAPKSGETVSYDGSGSAAPAGETITGWSWDLDGDGQYDDATGSTASFTYPTPGPRTVRLLVTSSGGGSATTEQVIEIANRRPVADFVISPESPRVGESVSFTSISSDPDGPIVEQDWDLDEDGDFDDASGAQAETIFPQAARYAIALRVRDANGTSDVLRRQIDVDDASLPLMSPFPVVRLGSEVKPNGKTSIKRLTARAPKGANLTLTCSGKSCSFDSREATASAPTVRFGGFERALAPGTKLRLYITKPDVTGKFTRFSMRNDKPPKRIDRCVAGELTKSTRCPSQ